MAEPLVDDADQHWSRVLLDALEEGFAIQGPDGVILASNPAARTILGLAEDQLFGRTSLDPRWRTVHEDGSPFPGSEHPAMVTLATGRSVSGQVMGVHRPDGSLVWIKVSSRTLAAGPSGAPGGVVTSFLDITAERATEAAVALHRQRLEDVVASLPVGILGMVDLLRSRPLDDDVLEVVERVRNATEALAVQLEDLLDLARIESGRLVLRPEPFDLRDLVERAVQVVGREARGKGVVLLSGVAGDVPDLVVGDGHRVRQVLLSLVANAVSRTAAGQVVVDVTATGPAEVTLSVTDTGPEPAQGPGEQPFAAFDRVDDPAGPATEGSGPGLAICSRLVALMGGRITVEPRPGVGARFDVVLPLATAPGHVGSRAVLAGRRVRVDAATSHAAQVLRRNLVDAGAVLVDAGADADTVVLLDADGGRAQGPLEGAGSTVRPRERVIVLTTTNEPVPPESAGRIVLTLPVTMARLTGALLGHDERRRASVDGFDGGRVLVAEDNATNALLLTRMLGVLGVRCDTVTDGTAALEQLRRLDYDVVLMDVNMPHLDGVAATRALRADEGSRHTPVLALTASSAAEEEQRCLAAGMDGFLTKPVGIAQLRTALMPYLGRAPQTEPGVPVLDPARLDELVEQLGDVELVRETVAAYLDELAPRCRAIDEAVSKIDRDALRMTSHTLRSSSAMLGAVAMARCCAETEAVALTATSQELLALHARSAGVEAATATALTAWAALT